MTAQEIIEGTIILIDKPLRWTSFDVVNKVRSMIRKTLQLKKIKVGHAGTLDPLATGLLIICTGKKTKEIEKIQAGDKEYIATISFGYTTPSYDLETAFDATFPCEHITEELIKQTLEKFKGEIDQVPPLFSAKSIDGRRAYKIARKGHFAELKPQKVTIHHLEIISWQHPDLVLKINCSKGTYIRSLAHDLGRALQSGSYLKALRRTASGNYHVKNAISIEDFQQHLLTLQPFNFQQKEF